VGPDGHAALLAAATANTSLTTLELDSPDACESSAESIEAMMRRNKELPQLWTATAHVWQHGTAPGMERVVDAISEVQLRDMCFRYFLPRS